MGEEIETEKEREERKKERQNETRNGPIVKKKDCYTMRAKERERKI